MDNGAKVVKLFTFVISQGVLSLTDFYSLA
jgi:hypothetical protein